MKLQIDTSRYDGVVSDNGFETSDVNNDGRTMFEYGWQPGDKLAPVLGLGNGTRSRGVSGVGNFTYTDAEGNIITQDDSGNLIAVVGPTADIYQGSSSTAVLAYSDGTIIQAGTQSGNVQTTAATNAPLPRPTNVTETDWVKLFTDNSPKVMAAINAWQLSQINIERAKAGKPPINASNYGPQIGVGLTGGTSNMLLYGALAVGAIMLMKK